MFEALSQVPALVAALYTLLAAGVIALMAVGAKYLASRAVESSTFALISRVYLVVQAVVAHVEAGIRPAMARALADGRLTPDEAKGVKDEALRLVKFALGDQLDALVRTLKLSGGALDVFLSGLIEQAHSALVPSSPAVAAIVKPSGAPFVPPKVTPVGPQMPPGAK